jgi:hypothetical protein
MAPQQEDFSQLPPLYERVTTATETPEELQHRLHLEKAKFYASAFGVFAIFVVLVLIIFFHEDTELKKSAQTMLQALAAGFIGYLVRR